MSQIKILTKEEIENFDLPPKSNTTERRKYFAIDSKIDEIIERIDNSTNKAGLVLMYGYFKISGKFFTTDKFHDEDVEYVIDLLDLEKDRVNFDKYMDKGYRRHKKLVCEICNYNPFADLDKNIIFSEIDHLIINQTRPRQIFSIFTEFLKFRRIELPNYHTISSLITNRLNTMKKKYYQSSRTYLVMTKRNY